MYLNAFSWESISDNSLPLILLEPRVYFNVGGGAVRPSIWASASSFGSSFLPRAWYTEILTEDDPALIERMIWPGMLTRTRLTGVLCFGRSIPT